MIQIYTPKPFNCLKQILLVLLYCHRDILDLACGAHQRGVVGRDGSCVQCSRATCQGKNHLKGRWDAQSLLHGAFVVFWCFLCRRSSYRCAPQSMWFLCVGLYSLIVSKMHLWASKKHLWNTWGLHTLQVICVFILVSLSLSRTGLWQILDHTQL